MSLRHSFASRRFVLVQAVTAVRLPLAAAFALVVLGLGSAPPAPYVALALLVLIEVSDGLDGWLARRLGVVSTWGEMFDPFVDSVSRLVVYWSLAAAGLTFAVLPLVMALRDVTVAYSRLLLQSRGRSVSARWSGKIKATVQGVGAMFLVLAPLGPMPEAATAVSWFVLVVTGLSAVEYVAAAVSRTPLKEKLLSIPPVGEDADFERSDDVGREVKL